MQRLQAIREKRHQPKPRLKHVVEFPNLKAKVNLQPLSDKIDGACFKRDLTQEHLWKKGREEKPETVKAIEEKKKRIRPKFGKGGYQYASDGDNEGPIKIYQKGC